MSDQLKTSIINFLKIERNESVDGTAFKTIFKDIKQKLKRNHSMGKSFLKSMEKSNGTTERGTRTSSINYGKKEVAISKFFDICGSDFSSSFASVSDISEKSIDVVKIEKSEETRPIVYTYK